MRTLNRLCLVAIPIITIALVLETAHAASDQYFVDETALRLPLRADIARDVDLNDVDGDGDLDIFFTNGDRYGSPDQSRLYINDGNGYFVDETNSRLPVVRLDTRGAAFADFDGDDDYDIILGSASNDPNLLWMNVGDGYYADESSERLPFIPANSYHWPEVGDLDGDGDFDFMLPSLGSATRIFINDGNGFFEDETEVRMPDWGGDSDWTNGLVFFDPDRDGDLDVIETNRSVSNRLLLNGGGGFFSDVSEARIPSDNFVHRLAAAADYDHNGFLDVAIPTTYSVEDEIWMNYGGFFQDETTDRFPLNNISSKAVAAADVDNDDWTDLVFGNNDETTPLQNILFRNVGFGYFEDVTSERMPILEDQTQSIRFGDLDSDGDVEIVSANIEEQNRLYINVGTSDRYAPRILPPIVLPAARFAPGPFFIDSHIMDNVSVNTGEIEASLFFSVDYGSSFTEVPMFWRGGELFEGEIPDLPFGTIVLYYFRAVDKMGNVGTDPTNAPAETYGFTVGRLRTLR